LDIDEYGAVRSGIFHAHGDRRDKREEKEVMTFLKLMSKLAQYLIQYLESNQPNAKATYNHDAESIQNPSLVPNNTHQSSMTMPMLIHPTLLSAYHSFSLRHHSIYIGPLPFLLDALFLLAPFLGYQSVFFILLPNSRSFFEDCSRMGHRI